MAKILGVIVNPVAGLGGRVGLKGSDGAEIVMRARELGAKPEAPARAIEALKALARLGASIQVLTYPGEMGEDECREAGLEPVVLGTIQPGATTSADTRQAARDLEAAGVDLLLFAGGDGTARDIAAAVDDRVVALGIPAGVKIHSAVYAIQPREAGEAARRYLEGQVSDTREAEVMDIDEEAFRGGAVSARLYGYLRVPAESQSIQASKSGSIASEQEALEAIAEDVVDRMADPECLYIIGPGTTTRPIMDLLGLPDTLLGVDAVRDRKLVASDATEAQLLGLLDGRPAKIVVTVIGGQGYIFGRGNQQISPRVIRRVGKQNIVIVATPEKLAVLRGRSLLVDTGDAELDRELSGYRQVTTGYHEAAMVKVG